MKIKIKIRNKYDIESSNKNGYNKSKVENRGIKTLMENNYVGRFTISKGEKFIVMICIPSWYKEQCKLFDK